MRFNPGNLEGEDTERIINRLVRYVTKTDEEIVEEGKEEKKKTNELKVFVAENRGFDLGALNSRIEELLYSEGITKHAGDFFDNHIFEEEKLNPEVSYVEIRTPDYDRADQFIFLKENGYLRVVTAERRKWTKKTVEKLIRYLPELERLFLSSNDLEEIVEDLRKTDISGFTAKYKPYYKDQKVTVQFHGAEEDDLAKVEEEFNARPTRMEFSQRNSPAEAVKGAINQEGYYSIPRVRKGSEHVGYDTIMQVGEAYEEHDHENFSIEHTPQKQTFEQGFTIEGFTTLELLEQVDEDIEENPTEEELIEQLEEQVLEGKRRYEFSVWEPGKYMVFDKERDEPFEITVEGRNLALHAKPATTSVTFRDFTDIIHDEFNSTYSLEKTSEKIGV